jgi:ArsR family transcriptional regulator
MDPTILTLKAIADESRLRILNLLLHRGELCVCDIEAILGATQTKVSRHLAYLRRSGLVSARRSGLWMLYSVPAHPDGTRKDVLSLIPQILRAHEVARMDLRRLDARMRNGCCAAASVSRPAVAPTLLELHTR